MSKAFLAIGDYLINPALVAYAVVEGPQLRLGFAPGAREGPGELRLHGEEGREVLRWLRLNAEFLSRTGGFGSIGSGGFGRAPIDAEPQRAARRSHATLGRSTTPAATLEPEEAVRS